MGNPALDKLEQENKSTVEQSLKDMETISKDYEERHKQKKEINNESSITEDARSVAINEEML